MCLLNLVSRFPPSPSHLTPIHPIFVAVGVFGSIDLQVPQIVSGMRCYRPLPDGRLCAPNPHHGDR